MQSSLTSEDEARQRRMSILGNASARDLVNHWQCLDIDPEVELLRGPETGLIALRGRIGGGGAPFNFGEATVTRATVRMACGAIGHAVMLGRDAGKVKLAAVIDALATDDAMSGKIEDNILTPLAMIAAKRDRDQAAKAQATRVNFFTMVRGDD
nr:phosphonate C-P lyase system protein PhnG [Cohaesibacter sp. ES.047]